MVVVHPDEVVSLRAVSYGVGITLVYCLVSLPVCGLEVAKILQIVEQRPDHLVGITVIKLVAFGFAKSDRHDFVARVTCGVSQRASWKFSRNSRPADPSAAAFSQDRFLRGDKSSSSWRHRPKVFACRI